MLELRPEVGNLIGRELGTGKEGGVGLSHAERLDGALRAHHILPGKVGLLLQDVSDHPSLWFVWNHSRP
jgi:hypothetical protein